MKKNIVLLCATIFFMMTLSAKLYNTYDVGLEGSGFYSLSEALELAENGDTLFLHEGVYEFKKLTIDKSVNIKGEGINKTVIYMTGDNPVMFFSNEPFYSAVTDLKILSKTSGIIIIGSGRGEGKVKLENIKIDCELDGVTVYGFGNRILNCEIKAKKRCILVVNETNYENPESSENGFSDARMRVKIYNCELIGNKDRDLEDANHDVIAISLFGHGEVHLGKNKISEVDSYFSTEGIWSFIVVED